MSKQEVVRPSCGKLVLQRKCVGGSRAQYVTYHRYTKNFIYLLTYLADPRCQNPHALTTCHTHGEIAPGGDVSALLVGTYRFPQVAEYVIHSSSAIVFLAKQSRLVWARNVVKQFGVLEH